MAAPRIAFVTGDSSRWRARALAAKYRLMRLERMVYPDVYSIPFFVADRFDFVPDGTRIPNGRYDLIISELNYGARQLEYLDSLVATARAPVAIIPGPPELLAASLTEESAPRVRRILAGSAHVWAYSDSVKSFVDGLVGTERSRVIPWPFDAERTRRLGERVRRRGEEIRILLNAPLRFVGPMSNRPLELKEALLQVLGELSPPDRRRIRFSTFLYSDADRAEFGRTRFSEGLGVTVERKRSYAAFVRFLAGRDAVINLTTGGVLGRITFLTAALDRPGLFSDNSELNRSLYPAGAVPPRPGDRLVDPLRELVHGLVSRELPERFRPSAHATAAAGDFRASSAKFRGILDGAA